MANKYLNLNIVAGAFIVLVFAVISLTGTAPFRFLDTAIYDLGIKSAFSDEQANRKIVLISIDEKSMKSLGRWPWPRDRTAEMIGILKQAGTSLLGLQIPFTDKKTGSGLAAITSFREKFNAYASALRQSEIISWVLDNLAELEAKLDEDRLLLQGVKDADNVILPVLGLFGSKGARSSGRMDASLARNFLTSKGVSEDLVNRLSCERVSLPFPELAQAAAGLGHMNLTLGRTASGKTHPLFLFYRGTPVPSFPLRLAIADLRMSPKQVIIEEHQVRLKGRSIPLYEGEMLPGFQNMAAPFPRFSFADILSKKTPAASLKGKIALIGFETAESRRVDTPLQHGISELEYTARVLDGIMNQRFISRPPSAAYIEVLAVILLGGLSLFLFPAMGQISRLGLIVALSAAVLIAGVFLISSIHIWVATSSIVGCLVAIYLLVTVMHFFTSEQLTRESIETNRMLGLSFQSQGLLDLAFDKFRKLPMEDETRELIYKLGLEFEKKRLINKAIEAYEYANKGGGFKDLDDRIPRLRDADKSSTIGSHGAVPEASIIEADSGTEFKKLGRYEILGELGKGSMGLVYKALDPKINRLLAIKTIRFSDEFDDDVIQEIKERFFREAEIAGKLSHPSIVTIYDVGEYRDLTYMAMEFLEGEDLENFISKKTLLPLRKVLEVVGRVAEALDFAHRAEVIHRDIKPANIMLLKSGGVKVTDFGIAKAISSSRTKTGVILGTPNYMSPEQIMGQKIDQRSDIFSLGVLFYQLLTGETPFHGDNLSALLYQITQVKQPSVRSFNPKIPKVCEQIVEKALAKNPDARFKTAGEMAKFVKTLGSKIDQLREKKATQG